MIKNPEADSKPVRIIPGIILIVLLWGLRYGLLLVFPSMLVVSIMGSMAMALLVIIWWVVFSRVPRLERWGGILLMVAGLFVTNQFLHVSLLTAGQGMLYFIYAMPFLCLILVAWAVARKYLPEGLRRPILAASLILASGFWLLLRIDGITGDFYIDLEWRWTKTAEEMMLSRDQGQAGYPHSLPDLFIDSAEWPGFRGPERNAVVLGVKLDADWKNNPPEKMWQKAVGPGCSSFAVRGDLFYTQEQRGEEEQVTCYNLRTGQLIWQHSDSVRFWDSHAGAGPRATPTLDEGRVYALGATGTLNVLDALDGTLIWSQSPVLDAGVSHSGWGYAASPLVVGDRVIVAAVGCLIAYHKDSGERLWTGRKGGDSYSSPHLVTIDTILQVLLQSGTGVVSVDPVEGKALWEYLWEGDSRIVQPALMAGTDLFVPGGDGMRMKRLHITRNNDEWIFTERWSSTKIQPNFNDFVVHKNHIFGFRGTQLVCLDADDGKRIWTGGRYGGQILLLAEEDLLLILTESGNIALVRAIPDNFEQVAEIEAIHGKTWNHPALAGDVLLVRNSEEMAAFRLPEKN